MDRHIAVLVYVDTNVIVDLLLNRTNMFGKNLGDRAAVLVDHVITCKHFITISDWTVRELQKNGINIEQLKMLLGFVSKKVTPVTTSEEDKVKAMELDPDNYDDALHVILALKAGANVIATRNLKHFMKYRHLIKPELPENL